MQRLITTAISYPNGEPHIGHMYEAILADIYNRLSILNGIDSKLLTGTDEHGKKIQMTAESKNMTSIELCDQNSQLFKQMLNLICVNYDRFIRTTDEDHNQIVKMGLELNSDDIYKSMYRSYYNIREESFVTETEAQKNDYKDPMTGLDLDIREEETYMFSLSRHKEYIIENLHRVLNFNTRSLHERLDDLHDLSISRIKSDEFNWGIDFNFDTEHIVYVWFDALLNYITGEKSLFDDHPQIIHVIGKDIVWFHSVIYPAIIKSFHPIYDSIIVHGFIIDSNGNKMSKTLGNVISPNELLSEFDVTYIRFYLFWETNSWSDIKFSKDRLKQVCKSVLIDEFGNLFQRVYNLLQDLSDYPFHEFIYEQNQTIEYLNDFSSLREILLDNIKTSNKLISDEKPWLMNLEDKKVFMINIGTKLHIAMSILSCIIPTKIIELNSYLGFNIVGLDVTSYTYVHKLKAFSKKSKDSYF